MPRYKFTPGTSEQWETLDRVKVDPAHAWQLFEHLVDYVERASDCPEPLRRWLIEAFDESRGSPGRLAVALGLKPGRGRRPRAGLLEVVAFVHEKLKTARNREHAISQAVRQFGMKRSTVRSYLDQYERALRVGDS